jgi:hypothetical protein
MESGVSSFFGPKNELTPLIVTPLIAARASSSGAAAAHEQ